MTEVMNFIRQFDFGMNGVTGSVTDSEEDQPYDHRSLHVSIPETTGSQEVREVDVLCGRDKTTHAHKGNKRFRCIVMKNRAEYQSADSRDIKSIITHKIVSMVKENGGRFLKHDEVTRAWTEVSDNYAREKVSHALRSAKDPHRPKPRKQREVKKYVPTAEDDALFKATLADQQRIFKRLTQKEAARAITSKFNCVDSDSLI